MSTGQSRRLIFGCGYVGLRAANRWHAQGDEVFAVTRSADRAALLAEGGLRPIIADVTDENSLVDLPSVDTVLFAVGYDRSAGKPIEDVYVAGLAKVLDHLPTSCGRLIYVSSTGVYGDAGGQVVDEQTPCDPQRSGGKACWAAEELLRADPRWQQKHVSLRLAGIYGPGRIPRAKEIAAQIPIPTPGEGALNLIHVDDAVETVMLTASHPSPKSLYVISDGHPVERTEYYAQIARSLNAPPPVYEAADPASPAALRAASNRRMSNRLAVEHLGLRPHYPDYRAGLAAILGSAS
ncbi:SDR family oxidoreductase [Blastopirellula sp. JC732]|uniref:SDR family oxidoreductase n=1 Tax=Blastopirellula sediminis TaxID=2894196 RepID=A0A9X1SLQ0_9BACT|nr:SDR family oxidoreductase [Blastopirellula sediminis]MCC9605801.1 SDR family oxidoreductase [Blastopirellula sediminis]MCC9630899.1 SDR family oxidoreductase [Blastopirellula sediminis]